MEYLAVGVVLGWGMRDYTAEGLLGHGQGAHLGEISVTRIGNMLFANER